MISELHNDDNRMHRYSIRGIIYAISSFLYDEIVLVSTNIHITGWMNHEDAMKYSSPFKFFKIGRIATFPFRIDVLR